ncbi:hypothetical protein JCM19239_2779 [Vibrio variabilis]|uniref:Uncharacterized protein n=1 Tax=Vibrio variabilis TaxID=990271 RepID=A0ABQ0JKA3_9VIBR|nr:hypothetical protein JCM19239_2779 [Vibrio variabilis]
MIYPETHVYEFTVKSELQARQKLEDIVHTIDEIDSGPSYIIEYKNSEARRIALKSFDELPYLKHRADLFEWKKTAAS